MRYLLFQAVSKNAKNQTYITRVTDNDLSDEVIRVLQDSEFIPSSLGWTRYSLGTIESTLELKERLALYINSPGSDAPAFQYFQDLLIQAMEEKVEVEQIKQFVLIERSLWPLKINDVPIPTFMIPINSEWAKHLFDEELAKNDLFGAEEHLSMSWENVYYRAARPNPLRFPARILWYVPDDGYDPQTKSVRACSYLTHFEIGPPKDLYRRFQNLGVYKWRDVYQVAKSDTHNAIMAIQFSHTELFRYPVPLNDIKKIINDIEHRGVMVQSPILIRPQSFAVIYQRGIYGSISSSRNDSL